MRIDDWNSVPLGDVCRIENGFAFKSSSFIDSTDGVPVIRISDLGEKYVAVDDSVRVKAGTEFERYRIMRGDILIALSGSLGKIAVYNRDAPAYLNQRVGRIRCESNRTLDPRYLLYFLKHKAEAIAQGGYGGTLKNISSKDIEQFKLPLPSFEIQEEIAKKIDTLFAEIDAGAEELKQAKEKLELYNQSVLNAAIRGKLVPQDQNDEPASKLLERIRAEKDQLIKAGKLKKEKPLPPIDPSEVPFELPRGWEWAYGRDVFAVVTSGSRGWGKYRGASGPLFLGMGNLDHGTLNLDLSGAERVMLPKGTEGVRTRLTGGDLLISITADVGMIGLVPSDLEEAYINQHVALARPLDTKLSPFLGAYLISSFGRKALRRKQRGATKVGLGLDDIRESVFPTPPLEEQQRISKALNETLPATAGVGFEIHSLEEKRQRLKQSILKSAFEGNLL